MSFILGAQMGWDWSFLTLQLLQAEEATEVPGWHGHHWTKQALCSSPGMLGKSLGV